MQSKESAAELLEVASDDDNYKLEGIKQCIASLYSNNEKNGV
jgi:hypothetical protein